MAEPQGASSFQQQLAMGAGGGADPGHYPGVFNVMPKGAEKAGGVAADKNLSPFQGNENMGGIASILCGAIGSSSKNILRAIFSAIFPPESLKAFSGMTTAGPWGVDPHPLAADKEPRQFTGGHAGEGVGMGTGAHGGGIFNNSASGDSGGGGGGGGGSGGGGGGSSGGGDGGGDSGSNHAFTAAHAASMGMSGRMADASMGSLGGLHPDPSPGIGAGRSAGMGVDF